MKRDRIILLARAPIPGRVKTRLSPWVDAATAAQLHVALVRDACELLLSFRDLADIELCLDGPSDVWAAYGFAQTLQIEGSLGDRMHAALSRAIHSGYRQAVLIGSDSPGLPATHIRSLLDLDTDAALGPAEDGGYYAIKCRRVHPAMFDGVRWSTSDALADTADALARCGLTVATGPRWFDIDQPSDVLSLAARPGLPRHAASWIQAHVRNSALAPIG